MPLQVLVDNGEYMLQNKGDLAMIAVTIDRVLEHWPGARVGVLTFVPRMLPAYLPRRADRLQRRRPFGERPTGSISWPGASAPGG